MSFTSPNSTDQQQPENDSAANLVEKILAEGAIGMQAAARLLGTFRSGAKTHPSTVTRWCKQGIRLADGRLLRLESITVTGRISTSRPAIIRFLAAQQPTATESPADTTTPTRSPAARSRGHAQAAKELDALGVK